MFKQVKATLDRKEMFKKAIPQLVEDYHDNVEVEFTKEVKTIELSHISKSGEAYTIKDTKEVEVLTIKIGRYSKCIIELSPKTKDGTNYALMMSIECTGNKEDEIYPQAIKDIAEFISVLYFQSVVVINKGKETEFNNHLKNNSQLLDNLIEYYLT